jgi:transcriptional regulator with XRE-family HTH domain
LPPPVTIGGRLRAAIGFQKRRIPHRELAEIAGVHENTVSKWLNDRQVPEPAALDALADFLGVSSRWLRYGEETPVESSVEVPYESIVKPSSRNLNGVRERTPLDVTRVGKRSPPPPVYAEVFHYQQLLEQAGVDVERVELFRDMMESHRLNQLRKSDPRERSIEDQLKDVRALWRAIRETLIDEGYDLP